MKQIPRGFNKTPYDIRKEMNMTKFQNVSLTSKRTNINTNKNENLKANQTRNLPNAIHNLKRGLK